MLADKNGGVEKENSYGADQIALFRAVYIIPKRISTTKRTILRVKSDIARKTLLLETNGLDGELKTFFHIFFNGRMRPSRPMLTFSLTLRMYRQGERRVSHISFDLARKEWREYRYGVRDCADIRYIFSRINNLPAVLHQVASIWNIQNVNVLDVSDLENFVNQRRLAI